jgi:lactobin A/cerein 7B family class IIb bacteriocin
MSDATKHDVSEDPQVESLDQSEIKDAELEQISGGVNTIIAGTGTGACVTATLGCKKI